MYEGEITQKSIENCIKTHLFEWVGESVYEHSRERVGERDKESGL